MYGDIYVKKIICALIVTFSLMSHLSASEQRSDLCEGLDANFSDAKTVRQKASGRSPNKPVSPPLDSYERCYLKTEPYYSITSGKLRGTHYICESFKKGFEFRKLLLKWKEFSVGQELNVLKCYPKQLSQELDKRGASLSPSNMTSNSINTLTTYKKGDIRIWLSSEAIWEGSSAYGIVNKIGISSGTPRWELPPQRKAEACDAARKLGIQGRGMSFDDYCRR